MNVLNEFLNFQYETIEILDTEKEIYLVKDQLSGLVYIKRAVPSSMADLYRILCSIQHKNLVHVVNVYPLEDSCLVIEEYVNGISLENLLKQQGHFPKETAKHYIQDLCRALNALHEAQLVHRDVNAGNIYITTDGVLKLMDFDTVRLQRGNQAQDTTLLGTPGYAAPEQFGFSESDRRTDIYAVGVLLNKMLTGKFPADGIYSKDKPLMNIIQKCTQLDKTNRYSDIRELLNEFERTKRGYYMQKFYRLLPGLGLRKWYWKCLACIGYIIYLSGLTGNMIHPSHVYLSDSLPGYLAINLFKFFLPFAALFNFGNYEDRLFHLSRFSFAVRFVIRAALFLGFAFLGTWLERV